MRTRVLANTEVRDGWRLIRLDSAGMPAAGPGQWYRLGLEEDAAGGVLPVYLYHPGERWLASLLPADSPIAGLRQGGEIALDGPFGRALPERVEAPALVCGIGAGVAPAMALAERLQPAPRLVVLDGSRGIPGRICPSRFLLAGLPEDAIAGVASLESAGVVARVADPRGRPGCFEGDAVSLLRQYAASMKAGSQSETPLLALSPWQPLASWQGEMERLFASVTVCGYPA